MFEDNSKYRVLKHFFMKPTEKHQLREISREIDLGAPSVKSYVEELQEEGFLEKMEVGVYPGYKASMSDKFKLFHKLDTVRRLHNTGLVEQLEKKFRPNSIVLFGSAVNGEDTEQSDIDILVVAGEKDIDLEEYEEEFNREINLQFNTEEELIENKEFSNSLANGIVLSGFLKVK